MLFFSLRNWFHCWIMKVFLKNAASSVEFLVVLNWVIWENHFVTNLISHVWLHKVSCKFWRYRCHLNIINFEIWTPSRKVHLLIVFSCSCRNIIIIYILSFVDNSANNGFRLELHIIMVKSSCLDFIISMPTIQKCIISYLVIHLSEEATLLGNSLKCT